MHIQVLEARRLFSGAALLSGGVLSITGTDAVNFIRVRYNAPAHMILVEETTIGVVTLGSFNEVSVKSFHVELFGGDDLFGVSNNLAAKPRLTIDGGGGNDTLAGTWANDVILGGPGDDRLTGGDGDDRIDGGEGNDNLSGDLGNDKILGNVGTDVLIGGVGNDLLDGGTQADHLFGSDGNDTVTYAARTNPVFADITETAKPQELPDDGEVGEKDFIHADVENLVGGAGNDLLVGTTFQGAAPVGLTFNNRLAGGPGNDTLQGLGGDDVLDGGTGRDSLNGGGGVDTADYASRTAALRLSLDGVANDGALGENDLIAADVENLTGGLGADLLVGNAAANVLIGNGGNDTIRGGAGNDRLTGGAGQDKLYGEAGDDTLFARRAPADADRVDGGIGRDGAQVDFLDAKFGVEFVLM